MAYRLRARYFGMERAAFAAAGDDCHRHDYGAADSRFDRAAACLAWHSQNRCSGYSATADVRRDYDALAANPDSGLGPHTDRPDHNADSLPSGLADDGLRRVY